MNSNKIIKNMKNREGITLVALVITIIILLILAGITIGQLTGSGIFNKIELAKEKWKNSQELENSILGDYEDEINLNFRVKSRGTIELTEEELQNLIDQKVSDGIASAKQKY